MIILFVSHVIKFFQEDLHRSSASYCGFTTFRYCATPCYSNIIEVLKLRSIKSVLTFGRKKKPDQNDYRNQSSSISYSCDYSYLSYHQEVLPTSSTHLKDFKNRRAHPRIGSFERHWSCDCTFVRGARRQSLCRWTQGRQNRASGGGVP